MNNPTTNTKFEDIPVGTRVQVVSHCVDFHFFYGETGVVTKAEDRYLGIKVRFDRPQKFKCVGGDEIYEKEWHNFHPKNLKVISNNGDSVNEQLRSRIKELEGVVRKCYEYFSGQKPGPSAISIQLLLEEQGEKIGFLGKGKR